MNQELNTVGMCFFCLNDIVDGEETPTSLWLMLTYLRNRAPSPADLRQNVEVSPMLCKECGIAYNTFCNRFDNLVEAQQQLDAQVGLLHHLLGTGRARVPELRKRMGRGPRVDLIELRRQTIEKCVRVMITFDARIPMQHVIGYNRSNLHEVVANNDATPARNGPSIEPDREPALRPTRRRASSAKVTSAEPVAHFSGGKRVSEPVAHFSGGKRVAEPVAHFSGGKRVATKRVAEPVAHFSGGKRVAAKRVAEPVAHFSGGKRVAEPVANFSGATSFTEPVAPFPVSAAIAETVVPFPAPEIFSNLIDHAEGTLATEGPAVAFAERTDATLPELPGVEIDVSSEDHANVSLPFPNIEMNFAEIKTETCDEEEMEFTLEEHADIPLSIPEIDLNSVEMKVDPLEVLDEERAETTPPGSGTQAFETYLEQSGMEDLDENEGAGIIKAEEEQGFYEEPATIIQIPSCLNIDVVEESGESTDTDEVPPPNSSALDMNNMQNSN